MKFVFFSNFHHPRIWKLRKNALNLKLLLLKRDSISSQKSTWTV